MTLKGFTRAGHFPTLIAALLYFDVSFMTWVMLGPLAPFLREDLGLSSTQQALGLFGCAGVFVAGTVVLLELGARWSLRWDLQAVRQAGVYSYRTALFGVDTERAA